MKVANAIDLTQNACRLMCQFKPICEHKPENENCEMKEPARNLVVQISVK